MGEGAPRKEIVVRGDLFFLTHPGREEIFSGYGLAMQAGRKDYLTGLLMVDRPRPVDPGWIKQIEKIFGEYQLVTMTRTGERGIVCRMYIQPDSIIHLRQFSWAKSNAITKALEPLLKAPPKPTFILGWNDNLQLWQSQIVSRKITNFSRK